MSTEIYYFSGTGNSLHVAKELQKRLPGSKLIPIVSFLDNDVVITKGETVGFVFPIYFTTVLHLSFYSRSNNILHFYNLLLVFQSINLHK